MTVNSPSGWVSVGMAACLVLGAGCTLFAQERDLGSRGPGRAGRERRSDRPGAEPDGPAAPGRARDQGPAGARRVPDRPPPRFLPPETQRLAYDDESIPIGEGQTITPPYDVAFMTEVLEPKPTDRVYEVGTGSGYQSAILSRLVKDVYSVEIHAPLGQAGRRGPQGAGLHEHPHPGRRRLRRLARGRAVRRDHRHLRPGEDPAPLVEQLKEGGRMVIPLGDRFDQMVYLVIKKDGKLSSTRAQADAVRPDDRPGPARGRRRQGRGR